jgi:predicted enzyme related to lactoylglutathione lyase
VARVPSRTCAWPAGGGLRTGNGGWRTHIATDDCDATATGWNTTFEVADTDATLARASSDVVPEDTPYGRSATLTDPFGVEYSIIARP